ncbi:MAG: folate family ECF transporter S component [Lachnospiraceae bacterium]|nr:folate family ECF transporter S component [Lachnospiraceae bacterium]MDD7333233.1 folate family ECF transporter S component [Lachnospiraceae bacterium]MDY5521931.1 folate family ECF transporter S component [Agathobacter sp.]
MKKFKELYLSSVRELASPKNLALCGVMGALSLVLGIVASIQIGPYIKIGFSGLPNRIVECLFGPVIGCIFGGTMDILKFIAKPDGPFFFGFTFDAMLAGVLYGSILYKKPVTIPRVFVAEFAAKVIVNCGFNTLWISVLYGKGFLAILPMRLLKNAIMLPIDTIITFAMLTLATQIATQFHFSKPKLNESKK